MNSHKNINAHILQLNIYILNVALLTNLCSLVIGNEIKMQQIKIENEILNFT